MSQLKVRINILYGVAAATRFRLPRRQRQLPDSHPAHTSPTGRKVNIANPFGLMLLKTACHALFRLLLVDTRLLIGLSKHQCMR